MVILKRKYTCAFNIYFLNRTEAVCMQMRKKHLDDAVPVNDELVETMRKRMGMCFEH
jgi:hypothetical protein